MLNPPLRRGTWSLWIWFCQVIIVLVLVVIKDKWSVVSLGDHESHFGIAHLTDHLTYESWDFTVLRTLYKAFWFNIMWPNTCFSVSLHLLKSKLESFFIKCWRTKVSVYWIVWFKRGKDWRMTVRHLWCCHLDSGRMFLAGELEADMILAHGAMTWNGTDGLPICI